MRIVSATKSECEQVLKRVSLGRLGCSLDNQPYVIPLAFTYEPDRIYAFSTLGKKIQWMRKNPKVCLQVDEIGNSSHWTSVLVNGTYIELSEPQYTAERQLARASLAESSAQWWTVPLAERREQMDDIAIQPIFFRIDIGSMMGLRGIPEA